MNEMFWLIVVLISIYTIIPTLVIRLFGLGAFKRGKVKHDVALTFDDGPDPEYTPRLLDLLKKYNILATFFVLGSKAKEHPDLIRRMHREGHLVGVHNYLHWANALMTPWKVRLQLQHAVEVIESITGERPLYYRPPWGVINLFDFLLLKNFRMVLWSIIVGDWRSKGGKHKIKHRLLSRLKAGGVIVLHDSGQTLGANRNAPNYMLEALADFISETISKGYSFVRIDEGVSLDRAVQPVAKIRWQKRLLVPMWLQWENWFHSLFALQQVDPENKLIYCRVRTYHGKNLHLADEEIVRRGDRVMELHLNNEMLFQMAAGSRSMVQLAVQMIRSVRQLLPKITEKISVDPDYTDIKCIYGITMIHRGTIQLGFSVVDLPKGVFAFLAKYYLRALLYVIHPDGKERLKLKTDFLTPKMIAMSAKELKKRYVSNKTREESIVLPAISMKLPATVEEDVPQSVCFDERTVTKGRVL